ncbi:DNA polymerase III subunit delta' [Vulgatibacter sp.]|uniref:DNA polymerase III subunit delta' n=1 Tax=Vulgatibacter sp. TaxID=1971226 RepID=UPI003563B335
MKLSAVQGQPRAIRQLEAALRNRRVHHAWLFAGPPGVGKEMAARAFAAALLCAEGGEEPAAEACGSCDACQRVARGVHPDFVVVMPEAEAVHRKLLAREDLPKSPSRDLKIDQIRQVESQLVHAPLVGRRRVVLLLRADSLNAAAQNAFLKTLEEPPEGTHLVLVADAADGLLPTIRSRCVRVPFVPLPIDFVAARVREEKGVDEETARLCAALAGGSLGEALAVSADSLADRVRILEALEALAPTDLRPLLGLAETIAGSGREATELRLDVIALFYRDVALAAEGLPDDALANRDLAPLVRKAAARGAEQALGRVRLAGKAKDALRRHASARLAVEQMLLAMIVPEEIS